MNRSVERSIMILEYLSRSGRPVGVSELARALGIPKSSMHDCLSTLLDMGCVETSGGGYVIGRRSQLLAAMMFRSVGVGAAERAVITGLHLDSGLSASIWRRDSGMVLCMAVSADEKMKRFAPKVGETREMHLTAPGKAVLSMSDDESVGLSVGTGCYTAHTANSIVTWFSLTDELAVVRKRGFAVEEFENSAFTWALAAPYRQLDGAEMAVSLEMRARSAEAPGGDEVMRLSRMVMRTAKELGRVPENDTDFCVYERKTIMAVNTTDKDNSLLPAGYIYDETILHDPNGVYADEARKFQGIPGIESTPGGRFFITFYAGMEDEGNGNFLLIYKSADGKNFGKAFMAVVPPAENTRCFDPCLWMSPDGKLRLFWAQSSTWFDGRVGVWCAVCDNPDADEVRFSAPERIANGVMMNKPIALKNGDWLLPCAILAACNSELNFIPDERFSNVYRSTDGGKTYRCIGHCDCPDRLIDEHMLYEREDGTLVMLVRTNYGIGESVSTDGGVTWSTGHDSGLGGPNSRFCVRRLRSGRLLLVNHKNFKGRNNLTAMLSEDDGHTWSDGILLDERNDVSYPDVTETADGYLHIVYDYHRYSDKEILVATLNEDDILAGKPVSEKAELKRVVIKAYGVKRS